MFTFLFYFIPMIIVGVFFIMNIHFPETLEKFSQRYITDYDMRYKKTSTYLIIVACTFIPLVNLFVSILVAEEIFSYNKMKSS